LFEVLVDERVGAHRFVRVAPSEPLQLIANLAPRIRNAYFDVDAAKARLRDAAEELALFDGSALVTEDEIEEALADELDSVLPADWKGGRPKHTDPQRSELAEILAAEILASIFGAVVPASRILNKEIPDQQTRGVDVLALEDVQSERVTLIIGEVKASSDAKSPPGVVGGMEEKLVGITNDARAMRQELIWLRDHCEEEYAELCSRLCARFLLKRGTFSIVIAPILVRTSATLKDTDCGRFRSDASAFGSDVRFTTIVLDVDDLFEFATTVYQQARRLGSE
jgi:hypothetical protein